MKCNVMIFGTDMARQPDFLLNSFIFSMMKVILFLISTNMTTRTRVFLTIFAALMAIVWVFGLSSSQIVLVGVSEQHNSV